MALHVAAATDQFRGVLALGASGDPTGFSGNYPTYDGGNRQERDLRAPIRHLDSIRTPTWIIEGYGGNAFDLRNMRKSTKNPNLTFLEFADGDHFNIIALTNAAFAKAMTMAKTGKPLVVDFKPVLKTLSVMAVAERESQDRSTVRELLISGCGLSAQRRASRESHDPGHHVAVEERCARAAPSGPRDHHIDGELGDRCPRRLVFKSGRACRGAAIPTYVRKAEADALVSAWAHVYPPTHANWQTLGPAAERCLHWSGAANLAWCPNLGVVFYAVDRLDALPREELKRANSKLAVTHPKATVKRATFRRDPTPRKAAGRIPEAWAAEVSFKDGTRVTIPKL